MASRLEVRHELGPRPERASARGFASTLTRDAPAAPATSLLTRVRERLTARRISDGRIGYGPSEYLEQIIDGGQVRVDQ
jgi:hypothetical protein